MVQEKWNIGPSVCTEFLGLQLEQLGRIRLFHFPQFYRASAKGSYA